MRIVYDSDSVTVNRGRDGFWLESTTKEGILVEIRFKKFYGEHLNFKIDTQ